MPKKKKSRSRRRDHFRQNEVRSREYLEDAFAQRSEEAVDHLDKALASKTVGSYIQALHALVACERLLRSLVFHASELGDSNGIRPRNETIFPGPAAGVPKRGRMAAIGAGYVHVSQGQTRKPGGRRSQA